MDNPILEIKHLKINFRTEDGTAEVINDVNIKLNKGEVIALVGESGCGKSVTVKSVLGLVPVPPATYVRGEILFKGRNLMNLKEEDWQQIRGRGISMIFQDPMTSLNPVFTIGQQLTDVYLWQGKKRFISWKGYNRELRQKARARAIELLTKMRIPDPEAMLDRYPVELSGGMRQRILIALALVHNPELLIADEPGTALDVSVQDQILVELKRLIKEEGISMIFITHNLGVARMISDRTYVMYAGEVVEEGKTEKLFERQYHPYTKGLLQSLPKLSGGMGEGIDGRIPSFTRPPQGCRFYDRCPERANICQTVPPTLGKTEDGRNIACHLYKESGEKSCQKTLSSK